MSNDVRIYLIVETSLRIVVDASFLVLYLLRIYKLDRMASNNFHEKPKLMKFKLALLCILESIFLAHIALSFTTASYWVYPYKEFALVSIADLINGFLQIYMVRKQHKKKAVKSIKVGLLWVMWLLLDMANIILVEVQIPNTTIFLIIFEGMVLVALIVIGFLLQEKNEQREQIMNTTPRSPLMTDQGKASRFYTESITSTHDSSKLYVQFNKQFNVSMRDSQAYCEFKFAVTVGEQSTILTRKQQQFDNLITEMTRTFPHCEQLNVKEKKHSSFSNIKKYGEEKQKVYETYLIKLTQNQKYYTNFLLDFLEVSPQNRTRLNKRRQKTSYQKKDSLKNEDQEKHKKPFFTVELINNKIHISNIQILQIVLKKSRSQIQKFHNKLIAERKLKMQLLSQNPDINQLVHFVFRVVNSKHLWKSFSQWMVLGKQLEEKIYNMFDFWHYGFSNIQLSIIGYEIAFDKEGSIHNLYLLSLSQKRSDSHQVKEGYFVNEEMPYFVLKEDVTLKKRFNDFVRLDKNVKKFINTNNIKAPPLLSLPPKFSPFGTKTSPKSRQIYLDMYLNQVIRIQEINHCVKFLEFLEVDLGRFRDEFQKIDEENLADEDISSMVIDELEDDRI